MIITIDGPAGAGKSTLTKMLAKDLELFYLDTGALYRAMTWKALEVNVDLKDEKRLVEILLNSSISIQNENILVDGQNVSQAIREERISRVVPLLAENSNLRHHMVLLFRKLAQGKNVIAEGRDLGSVVFPDAEVKFYLDASAEERSKRRYIELKSRGQQADETGVLKDLEQRDKRDQERKVAPLVCPIGAIRVDTTGKSIEEVFEVLKGHIQDIIVGQKGPKH